MSKSSPSNIGPDWESLPDASAAVSTLMRRGIFMDIVGPEGCGKSTLALTLAYCGKLSYVDIDQSVDRARKPESKKERDNIKTLPVRYNIGMGMGEDAIKAICAPVWSNIGKKLVEAHSTWAKGAVIDTCTEMWELNRLASAGTLNPKGKRMDRVYGPINARMRQVLRSVYRGYCHHLITVHQNRDEYIDKIVNGEEKSVRTGRQVRAGFKEIGYLTDIVIECSRSEDGEFKANIKLCKLPPNGPDLEGTELEGDQLDFAYIVSLATGTEREDWRK